MCVEGLWLAPGELDGDSSVRLADTLDANGIGDRGKETVVHLARSWPAMKER